MFRAAAWIAFVTILDWPLLKYMVGHSFDLYVQELCGVVQCICMTALFMDQLGQDVFRWFNLICFTFSRVMTILCIQCYDGYHVKNWVKHCIISAVILGDVFWFVITFYSISPWGQVEDILT